MLTTAQHGVRFVSHVGVAPATTTMRLDGAPLPPVMQSVQPGRTAPDRVYTRSARYYMPYASIEDLRSANAGFGIINEGDAWMTGRPYGLPGTAAIRLAQVPGGYRSPEGYHYEASMLGEAESTSIALQLQALVAQQKAQEESLRRIAKWQAIGGGMAIGATVLTVALGVAAYVRGR